MDINEDIDESKILKKSYSDIAFNKSNMIHALIMDDY
jgi:hypothetical protein